MSAEIENRSRLPAAAVRRTVRHVLSEFGVNRAWVTVRVFVTDHWHHHGHFYAHKRGDEDSYEVTIIARVPEEPEAHDRGLRGGPPPIDPSDWVESLVCICAHEATHVRQFIAGPQTDGYWRTVKGKRVFVGGRIFSEVQAEWAEYLALRRWRERRKQ